jgi:hypothetical protein
MFANLYASCCGRGKKFGAPEKGRGSTCNDGSGAGPKGSRLKEEVKPEDVEDEWAGYYKGWANAKQGWDIVEDSKEEKFEPDTKKRAPKSSRKKKNKEEDAEDWASWEKEWSDSGWVMAGQESASHNDEASTTSEFADARVEFNHHQENVVQGLPVLPLVCAV